MDPIGLGLENFDAVGKWRTREPGGDIDAHGQLADGTPISGAAELREALTANPEQFARVFTEKLLIYALGRGLEAYDMPTVRSIVRDAEDEDYRFAALVKGVASSVPFRMRRGQSPDAPPQPTVARADE
jgi:hypothetical protein